MATLDEILDYAMKRMSPRERAQMMGAPRNLFEGRDSGSLYARGIGLGGTIPATIGGGQNTVVNVPPPPRAASPAVNPQDGEDQALVRQAGFAEANAAVSPLMGDWRTTPVQALTAALAGYGRGSYSAKQDIAAGAEKRAEAETKRQEREAANAQRKALLDEIAKLPEDQRAVAMLDPGAYAQARAKALFPEPSKPQIVGGEAAGYFSVDPSTGQASQVIPGIGRAPTAPTARYESSGGMIFDKFTGQVINAGVAPPSTTVGKLIAERDQLAPDDPRRAAYDAAIAKETTRGDGITVGTDENGKPIVQIGGAGAPPKPPAGYEWTDNTYTQLRPIPGGPAEAASADLAGRMALLPGAKQDVADVRNLLVDQATGRVNRGAVVAANPPVPFGLIGALPGVGREVASRVMASIDTMVRLRSGASATEAESERLMGIYMPLATDTEGTVKSKLDRLDRDLKAAEEQFTRGKGGVGSAVKVSPTAPAPAVPLAPTAPAAEGDEYQLMFGVP